MNALRRLHKEMAGLLSRKRAGRDLGCPVVSFTFDDFPVSALTVAGAILEENGLRGTYYASAGLMGQATSVGRIFGPEDLESLLERGHELGCHTYDHVSCFRVVRDDFRRQCEKNRQELQNLLGGYQTRSFSFPFGDVRWSAKTAIASEYETCRTTEPGVNRNPVDLAYLRATPIYSQRPLRDLERLVADGVRASAWVILYTHDVGPRPSRYGCTPEYFRRVVQNVVVSGARVLTIAEASALLGAERH